MNNIAVFIYGEKNSFIKEFINKLQLPADLLNRFDFYIEATDSIEALKKNKYEVILLITLKDEGLIEHIKSTLTNHTKSRLIVFSGIKEADFICDLYEAGISAHLSSEDHLSELENAIQAVYAKEVFQSTHTAHILGEYLLFKQQKKEGIAGSTLTDRETEVFKYLCNGWSSPRIAEKLFRSVNTVRTHRQNIYEKLGAHNISDLMKYAIKNKIDIDIDKKP